MTDTRTIAREAVFVAVWAVLLGALSIAAIAVGAVVLEVVL